MTLDEWLNHPSRQGLVADVAIDWLREAWPVAVATEREACAMVADRESWHDQDGALYRDYDVGYDAAAREIAAAIRARSNNSN